MDNDEQTQAEIDAQYADESAARAADNWLRALLVDGDYLTAWAGMTPTLRLARAQAWLFGIPAHPDELTATAAALAERQPAHSLWPRFATAELNMYQRTLPLPGGDYGNIAPGSKPRPLGLDLELIHFVDLKQMRAAGSPPAGETGGVLRQAGEEPPAFATLVMQHDQRDGWLVASHNGPDRMPVPGWPPLV